MISITIPDSVTSIGDYAFRGCNSLPVIGNLRYADTFLVEAVNKSLGDYEIRKGTRFIGGGAFRGCSRLTNIAIPEGVTSIGNRAFSYCPNLTSITIPEGVTSIGGSAFEYCKNLTCIIIPRSVTSIGENAFNLNHKLSLRVYCEATTPPTKEGHSFPLFNPFMPKVDIYVPSASVRAYEESHVWWGHNIIAYDFN